MKNKYHHSIYWPQRYTQFALLFTMLIIAFFNLLFLKYAMPVFLLVSGILIIAFFFLYLNRYTKKWHDIAEKPFYTKLFWHSFAYRLVFVGYMYLLTWIHNPQALPLHFNARDPWKYWAAARAIQGHLFSSQVFEILATYYRSTADFGFPLYLGFMHSLVNSVIWVIFLNCVWGSLTVVLLSKISHIMFSYDHAKLTGILAMLMPPLMWFGAMYLKETVMIFLVVCVFYFSLKSYEAGKWSLQNLFIVVGASFSLFYFRTVLAVLVIFSVGFYIGLNLPSRRKSFFSIVFALVFFVSIYQVAIKSQQLAEAQAQYDRIDSAGENILSDKVGMVKNISVKQAAVLPFILAGAVVTPFPSFLDTDERQFSVLAHFPNELIRNLIYYFAFLGFFFCVKNSLAKSSLVLFFSAGYIFILAITSTSFLDRFQLPVLPFIIILISVGYINSSPMWRNRWRYYLILMFCAQVAWNVFKLSIRGIL